MRHPAYHLRPNKTADRFAFIEAINRLGRSRAGGLRNYTYHGLGGPYLEDFRLLYEFCPDIQMVSIEKDEETSKRQAFHRPCSTVRLVQDDVTSFIAGYNPGNKKSVFWLDYTGLEYSCFENFKALLSTVLPGSMIKVTLRSEPKDYWTRNNTLKRQRAEKFRKKFANVMPTPASGPPRELHDFATFLQGMVRVAAQQALPPTAATTTFVPVSSFCYSDGTGMFTLTGVVCGESERRKVEAVFAGWNFANLNWDPPKLIDVPTLSTKERQHLQGLLPSATGEGLQRTLGYLIDEDGPKTEAALEQYVAFHRYSPYVLRGTP